MKLTILTLLFFSCANLLGQNTNVSRIDTQNILKALPLTASQLDTLRLILNSRDNNYITSKLDTSTASLIIITEGYRFSNREYGMKEEYYFDSSLITTWLNRKLIYQNPFCLKSTYQYFDTIKNSIEYFPPNPIVVYQGCGEVKNKRKINISKLNRKADRLDEVNEDFFNIITYIDKRSNNITFKVVLPKPGKRFYVTELIDSHTFLTRPWL